MPRQEGPLRRVVAHERKPIPRKSLVVRFMEKVAIQPDGCWLWTAAKANEGGYGSFRHPETRFAHRAAYLLLVGPLEANQVVDHLCRQRLCVNPDHLDATTQMANIHRGSKGTPWKGCDRLHPDTPTRLIRRKEGTLRCGECHRVRSATAKRAARAAADSEGSGRWTQ